jgi:hypothetical protein
MLESVTVTQEDRGESALLKYSVLTVSLEIFSSDGGKKIDNNTYDCDFYEIYFYYFFNINNHCFFNLSLAKILFIYDYIKRFIVISFC